MTRTTLAGVKSLEISVPDRQTLRQYLLGQLEDADLSHVEERLMSDSKVYEEVLILEDELIDQYVRDQMTPTDRAKFLNYFLRTTEHQQKVRFARALSKYVDAAEPEETQNVSPVDQEWFDPSEDTSHNVRPPSTRRSFPWWPLPTAAYTYASVAILLVLIAGVSWIVIRGLRSAGPGRVFEATLTPSEVLREGGGAIQTISIPSGTDTLRLDLVLSDDHSSDYQVNLVASDGSSVWTRDHLSSKEAAGRKVLNVDLPAKDLKPDTYRIKLRGRSSGAYEEIEGYSFRVKQ